MRKEMIWSLSVFVVIFLAFFGIHYFILLQQGMTPSAYLGVLALLLPGLGVVGYIFLSQVLQKQQRHEERLEHLVREVLHEINLPLATIEANLQMLDRSCGQASPRSAGRLERIASAGERLRRLYRKLAYELRREIAPVQREDFDLAELLRERVEFFAEAGPHPIETHLEALKIHADRIGVEQMLDNLLENALKYSHPGSAVQVTLRGTELMIRDRGRGMDENELLRIFERYYQGDRRVEGEGIGLAIVKRTCDDEEIGLKILSKKGEGTKVILDFAKRVAKD